MILYEHEGFTLTSDHLAELAHLAGHGRKQLGIPKTRAEHAADDVLWTLGWCVLGRTPPDERAKVPA